MGFYCIKDWMCSSALQETCSLNVTLNKCVFTVLFPFYSYFYLTLNMLSFSIFFFFLFVFSEKPFWDENKVCMYVCMYCCSISI